jgi:hypothetical protein
MIWQADVVRAKLKLMANNGTLVSRTFAGVSITALAQQAAPAAD